MNKSRKKMMIKFFAIGLIALVGQACSGIDYDGEYSKEGYFEGGNQVFVDLKNTTDTLYNYSFGTQPTSVTTDTVNVKVKIAGVKKSQPQHFKVVVDPSSSAKAGVHFVALDSILTVPADSLTASFPVVLMRQNLSETQNDNIRLILLLKPTDDLGTRFPDKTKRIIAFNNVLEKPDWWDMPLLSSMGLPAYTPAKYRMLLSFYDSDANKLVKAIRNNRSWTELYRNIQKVVAYFRAHPE